MKRMLLAACLVLAALPAFAQSWETLRAAQVTISVAEQIRVGHHGDYADLGSGRETVALPWGSLLAFAGNYPDTGTSRRFGLHIDGVPHADCERYVSDAAPAFDDVWIGDAGPSAIGRSVFSAGHLDHAALHDACRDDMVGIDFITH
ncbi:MAG: hypothetical protein RSP_05020 [Rhodanobacter sp.]